jgi:hypothetical protein
VRSVRHTQAIMKQFHNRSTKAGTLVWDMDRMIQLAHELPRKTVPLESIVEFNEVY